MIYEHHQNLSCGVFLGDSLGGRLLWVITMCQKDALVTPDTVCSILFHRSNGRRIICETVSFQHLQVESKCNMLSSVPTLW